jgi:hypothetical protein
LKAGQWKEADEETAKKMFEVAGRTKEGYLRTEDIDNFPCLEYCGGGYLRLGFYA